MGESMQHITIIKDVLKATNEIIPEKFVSLILIDLPESNVKPPQVIDGFRPDIYYCHNNVLVIGEAKTSSDFERKHSKEQYLSFMRTCANYNGTAYLIIGVPWTEYISAKNLLRRMKKNHEFNINIKIINNLGKVELV